MHVLVDPVFLHDFQRN